MKAAMRKHGGGGGEETPFVPTHEWLDAYLAQGTAQLIEAAERYARMQSIKVGLVRHIDGAYAEELVQDILDDTFFGVIAWDPERVSLKKHVYDAIKSRTRHAYVHSLKFRALRMDVSRTALAAAEAALAHQQQQAPDDLARVTAQILDALSELAAQDHEVLLLLGAHRRLLTRKHDIIKMTGLSSKQYAAARRRLYRLTLQLPASLLEGLLERE
jgi:hypothetical protein